MAKIGVTKGGKRKMWGDEDIQRAIARTKGIVCEWRRTIASDERFDYEDIVQDVLVKYLEALKNNGEHPHSNTIRNWIRDIMRDSYGYVGSPDRGEFRMRLRVVNIKGTDDNTDEERLDALALDR